MAEFAQEIFAKIWQRINNPFSLVGIVKQQSWHTKANSATCQCGLQRSLLNDYASSFSLFSISIKLHKN